MLGFSLGAVYLALASWPRCTRSAPGDQVVRPDYEIGFCARSWSAASAPSSGQSSVEGASGRGGQRRRLRRQLHELGRPPPRRGPLAVTVQLTPVVARRTDLPPSIERGDPMINLHRWRLSGPASSSAIALALASAGPTSGFGHALGGPSPGRSRSSRVFALRGRRRRATTRPWPGVGFHARARIGSRPPRRAGMSAGRCGRRPSRRSSFAVPLIWVFALRRRRRTAARRDCVGSTCLTVASYVVALPAHVDQGPRDAASASRCCLRGQLGRVRGPASQRARPVPEPIEQSSSTTSERSGRRPERTAVERRRQDDRDRSPRSARHRSSPTSVRASSSTGREARRRGHPVPRRRRRSAARRAVRSLGGDIDDAYSLGGLVAIASGAVVGLVGGLGTDRRLATWIGVLVVLGGVGAVLVEASSTRRATATVGSAIALRGCSPRAAALVAGAWYAAPRARSEPVDGDDPTAAEPTRRHRPADDVARRSRRSRRSAAEDVASPPRDSRSGVDVAAGSARRRGPPSARA